MNGTGIFYIHQKLRLDKSQNYKYTFTFNFQKQGPKVLETDPIDRTVKNMNQLNRVVFDTPDRFLDSDKNPYRDSSKDYLANYTRYFVENCHRLSDKFFSDLTNFIRKLFEKRVVYEQLILKKSDPVFEKLPETNKMIYLGLIARLEIKPAHYQERVVHEANLKQLDEEVDKLSSLPEA